MSEVVVVCPECLHKKAYMNAAKGVGHCHRCKKNFGPSQVRKILGGAVVSSGPRVLSRLPVLTPAWDHWEARRFLESRQVTYNEAPLIEYDAEGRRLYFRIWSPSPELPASYHTRAIYPSGTWRIVSGTAKEGYLFGRPLNGACVLVEGIWDAIRIGEGAVALLGTSLSQTHLTYLRRECSRVLVYLDPDEPGQKAQKEILKTFRRAGIKCSAMVGAGKEPADYPADHEVLKMVREWLKGT
jgi:Toprim-like